MRAKNSWLSLIFVILFLLIYFLISGFIDKNYTYFFNYLPKRIWLLIWPLLLGGYFAKDTIQSWRNPGKIRIDYGYLLITILCSFVFFSSFALYGYDIGSLVPALGIISGHGIISTFNKEPFSFEEKIPQVDS